MNNFKYSILDMEEWYKPNQIRLMKRVENATHKSIALYNKKNKKVTISNVNKLDEDDLDAITKFIRGVKEYYE